MVRTSGFQPGNRGSTPRGVTKDDTINRLLAVYFVIWYYFLRQKRRCHANLKKELDKLIFRSPLSREDVNKCLLYFF